MQRTPRLRPCSKPGVTGAGSLIRDVRQGSSSRVNSPRELKDFFRNVIADGDFGMTLRTGEPLVVHSRNGPRAVEQPYPTHDEITAFLRQLTGSRGVREFRTQGVTRFIVPFDGRVRLVGAARAENDDVHVEIRRMVGRTGA